MITHVRLTMTCADLILICSRNVMYWVDVSQPKLFRSNLDGSAQIALLSEGLLLPGVSSLAPFA